MSDAMKCVRFAFMDLRNIVRSYGHNKNKQIVIDKIDIAIFTLLQLREEANR